MAMQEAPARKLSSFSSKNPNYEFVRKRVCSLKPSPENENLYRAVKDDPDIGALADSIKKHGLNEPLIITSDKYVVSGHRRLAALLRIGQRFCSCRVLPYRRDSMPKNDYVALLREHNRQRHKTVAEQVNEELVDVDPKVAYRNLCAQRDRSIYTLERHGVTTLDIEGAKSRYLISKQKTDHVKYIKQIVFFDRRQYWPLSVRGVHYPLLNFKFLRNIPLNLPYENDDQSYQATSDLITRLRLNGEIPWEAFDDGTRPMQEFNAFTDVRAFVRQEVGGLFGGYWRNLLQSQPNHIEVLCEKNTVYHMVLRVTSKYQIPTSSGRGFNSIDPWHDLYERYRASSKKRLILIVLSDFDPEGEMIPHVGGRTLRDDFGAHDIDIIKAGVTRAQIANYKLPSQNFAKEASSNHKWFVDRNDGDDSVYELEALEPEKMLGDLENIIKSVIDVDLYNREIQAEKSEASYLEAAKRKATEALKGLAD